MELKSDTKRIFEWEGVDNAIYYSINGEEVKTLDNCNLDRLGWEEKNYLHFERKRRQFGLSNHRLEEPTVSADSCDVSHKKVDWPGIKRAEWRHWVELDASKIHLRLIWIDPINPIYKSENIEDFNWSEVSEDFKCLFSNDHKSGHAVWVGFWMSAY